MVLFCVLSLVIIFVGTSIEVHKRREMLIPFTVKSTFGNSEEILRRLADYSDVCYWKGGILPPVASRFYVKAYHYLGADFNTRIVYKVPSIEGLIWNICVHGFDFYSEVNPQNFCESPTILDCPSGCAFDDSKGIFDACTASELCAAPMEGVTTHWKTEIDPQEHAILPCPEQIFEISITFQELRDTFASTIVEKTEYIDAPIYLTLAGYNNVGGVIFETNEGEDLNQYLIKEDTVEHKIKGLHVVMNSQVQSGMPSSQLTFELMDNGADDDEVYDIVLKPDFVADPMHHEMVSGECQENICKVFLEANPISYGTLANIGSVTLEIYLRNSKHSWVDKVTRRYQYSGSHSGHMFDITSHLWFVPYDKLGGAAQYVSGKTVMVDTSSYWVIEVFSELHAAQWDRETNHPPNFYYGMKDGERVEGKEGFQFLDYSSDPHKMQEIDPALECNVKRCYLWFFQQEGSFNKKPPSEKYSEEDVESYVMKSTTKLIYKGQRRRRGDIDEEDETTGGDSKMPMSVFMETSSTKKKESSPIGVAEIVSIVLGSSLGLLMCCWCVTTLCCCCLICCVIGGCGLSSYTNLKHGHNPVDISSYEDAELLNKL